MAPSGELRKWFAHDDEKFEAFTCRYRLELEIATAEIDELIAAAEGRPMTLVYGAKNIKSNNAVVLVAWLESKAH